MSYTITLSNGTTLCTIDDNELDNTTSLTLLGRNYAGYGTIVADNFVRLLENFSNMTPPVNPLTGQLWYNPNTLQLEIWTGSNWALIGVAPATLTAILNDSWTYADDTGTTNKYQAVLDPSILNSGVTFTGYISGTLLTIAAITSGSIQVGQVITGNGVAAPTIVTGPSGNNWLVSISQAVGSAGSPVMMTGSNTVTCYFTGYINGTALTVFNPVTSGTVQIGQVLTGSNVIPSTMITAMVNAGTSTTPSTWTINNSQQIGGMAIPMISTGLVSFTGYISLTVLTIVSVLSGFIEVGQQLAGPSNLPPGVTIQSGTGSVWLINIPPNTTMPSTIGSSSVPATFTIQATFNGYIVDQTLVIVPNSDPTVQTVFGLIQTGQTLSGPGVVPGTLITAGAATSWLVDKHQTVGGVPVSFIGAGTSNFTGYISNTMLTVTSTSPGTVLAVGQTIAGPGVIPGTLVTAQQTLTTWTINIPQTTGNASTPVAMSCGDYVTGIRFTLNIASTNDNIQAPTLKLNGAGSRAILNSIGDDITPQQLQQGGAYDFVYNGSAFQIMSPPIRTRLTRNLNVYVSGAQNSGSIASPGNNSATGMTWNTAWANVQYAWDYFLRNIDLGGYNGTIFANGAFVYTNVAALVAQRAPTGNGGMALTGMGGASFTCNNILCITVGAGVGLQLSNVTLSATGVQGSYSAAGSALVVTGACAINGVVFDTATTIHMHCTNGGVIQTNGNPYSIIGGAPIHIAVDTGGFLGTVNSTVNITSGTRFEYVTRFYGYTAGTTLTITQYTVPVNALVGMTLYDYGAFPGVLCTITGQPNPGNPYLFTVSAGTPARGSPTSPWGFDGRFPGTFCTAGAAGVMYIGKTNWINGGTVQNCYTYSVNWGGFVNNSGGVAIPGPLGIAPWSDSNYYNAA